MALATALMAASSGRARAQAPRAAAETADRPMAEAGAPVDVVAGPVTVTLAEAVARAAARTPAVEIADLRVDAADARADQMRAALLPSLAAGAGVLNRSFNRRSLGFDLPASPGSAPVPDRIGPFDNVDARLRLSHALFDPAAWLRHRAARVQVVGSEAERDAAAEAAAHLAAYAYLAAARVAAVVAAREADVAVATELVALAEAQVELGTGVAIDETRARTQLMAAEGQLLMARNRLERARLDLARALGLDPDTEMVLADSLADRFAASDAPEDPAVATELALRRRADHHAARSRIQGAESTRRAITAERLPRLELFADYGANGLTARDVIATHVVGVQLSMPIVDGMRRGARLAEQEAVVREAELRERDLRHQIAAEVRAALLDLESGIQQQRIADERVRLAELELEQAVERFDSGVAGNIEVINAQASLVRARDAAIEASFAAAAARIALARAAGVARSIR